MQYVLFRDSGFEIRFGSEAKMDRDSGFGVWFGNAANRLSGFPFRVSLFSFRFGNEANRISGVGFFNFWPRVGDEAHSAPRFGFRVPGFVFLVWSW